MPDGKKKKPILTRPVPVAELWAGLANPLAEALRQRRSDRILKPDKKLDLGKMLQRAVELRLNERRRRLAEMNAADLERRSDLLLHAIRR